MLCYSYPILAQCDPQAQLHFGQPDIICNEMYISIYADQLPATLAGMNVNVDIQPGGSGNYTVTAAYLNPILSGFSVSSSGAQLNWIAPQPIIPPDPMELFILYVKADEPDCFNFSFSGINKYFELIGGEICDFITDPPIEGCYPSFNLSGLVESTPPLDCDENIDHGVMNVDIETTHDDCLLCATVTNEAGGYSCVAFTGCQDYKITPTKEHHPDCGVTLLDHQMLQQHILFADLLDHPWQLVAADLDSDGQTDTYDHVLLGLVIQGNLDLPYSVGFRSWNFVPSIVYGQMADPIQPPYHNVPPFDPYIIYLSNQNPNQLDFIGIKVGDLNGSCEDCDSDFAPNPENRSDFPTTQLWIENASYQEGEIAEIFVHIDTFSQQSIYGVAPVLSSKYFEILGVKQGDYPGRIDYSIQGDAVEILWQNFEKKGVSLRPNEVLFAIKTKVIRPVSSLLGLITLSSTVSENLLFENRSLDPKKLQLEIRNRKPSPQPTFRLTPNPFSETTYLSFQTQQPGEVQLLIYNATGNLVFHKSQEIAAGPQNWTLGSTLGLGIYYAQLRTPDGLFTNRLIKMK